ncbi:Gfo/Idh/MocA family oxidoreductase, partial [Candidatus Pacearchaeota archaeon]|nr:Gfo/Idh/MocA family oxidoreductase [Candidatus Pacearchaeota archaeon]
MKIDIFIFGMGNMGKRHFQAISHLDYYNKIYCFDISQEAIASVKDFCSENDLDEASLVLMNDFDEMILKISKDSIVIVSTTANGRVELLESVMSKRPKVIMAEKPLCQNLEEYEKILYMSEENDVPIYINFPRHRYPFYQRIFSDLKNLKQQSFHAKTWGGMACNGIHVLELMTWLFSINKY